MSAKKKTSARGRVAETTKGIQANREGADPGRDYYQRFDDAVRNAFETAELAHRQWGPFVGAHEGFGVLAEEVAELFDAVRLKQSNRGRPNAIYDECIDVAAVALRLAACVRVGMSR